MNTHTISQKRTGVALFGAIALAVVVACGAQTSNLLGGDGGAGSGSFLIVGGSGNGQGSGGAGGSGSAGGPGALLPGVFTGNGACLKLGAGCTANGDCCSGDCVGGVCQYPACVADNAACTSNGQCCSQNCAGGTCSALNSSCSTVGNSCTSDATCCSKHCAANGTCQASSFCAQPGDACSVGSGCCTGTCNIAANQAVGTCAASAPGGPANCGLEDGQLCGGTGTSGTGAFDGGLPACGGACCSRACAPWGPTGVFVCQPASGCHVVGDLCMTDGDCCGSQGLPGGSHKPVTCVINAGDKIGVCRLPMGCKPDGDVCKLKTMSCNSSCDCCAGNCETQDTCHQDNVGVPRCSPATCVPKGQACASSADCCGGVPCVPNPVAGATPRFVCFSNLCVSACGPCTTTADCCRGSSCILPAGGTQGMCGPCGGGTPPSSGSTSGTSSGTTSGSPSSGTVVVPPADAGPAPACSQYGQACTVDADCCNGQPCVTSTAGGRCGVAYMPR